MDHAGLQAQIDSITWYHPFDFGQGLRCKDESPDAAFHRRLTSFIEQQLGEVSFDGKSVLDIGCWDGYWSFYAERRGAASVLATDDFSQNWSSPSGFHLAKKLLGSGVEIDPNRSVYELANLNRRFDLILFLGVYYHLWDPFHALAQIRHCCHPDSLVLIEGNWDPHLPPCACYVSTAVETSKFTPSAGALAELLSATYFRVVSQRVMPVEEVDPVGPEEEGPIGSDPRPAAARPVPVGWRWRLGMCREAIKGSRPGVKQLSEVLWPPPPPSPPQFPRGFLRTFLVCAPFEGPNEKHRYRPPFGLHRYDSRFQEA